MLWARRFLILKESPFAKCPSKKSPRQKKTSKSLLKNGVLLSSKELFVKKPSKQGHLQRELPQVGTLHRASSIAEKSLLQRNYPRRALSHHLKRTLFIRLPQKGPLYRAPTNGPSVCAFHKRSSTKEAVTCTGMYKK